MNCKVIQGKQQRRFSINHIWFHSNYLASYDTIYNEQKAHLSYYCFCFIQTETFDFSVVHHAYWQWLLINISCIIHKWYMLFFEISAMKRFPVWNHFWRPGKLVYRQWHDSMDDIVFPLTFYSKYVHIWYRNIARYWSIIKWRSFHTSHYLRARQGWRIQAIII